MVIICWLLIKYPIKFKACQLNGKYRHFDIISIWHFQLSFIDSFVKCGPLSARNNIHWYLLAIENKIIALLSWCKMDLFLCWGMASLATRPCPPPNIFCEGRAPVPPPPVPLALQPIPLWKCNYLRDEISVTQEPYTWCKISQEASYQG